MMLLALAIFCWFVSGVSAFIFWWTAQHDFTTEEIGTALLMGIVGPFAFWIGWMVHGTRYPQVLIPKRKKGDGK